MYFKTIILIILMLSNINAQPIYYKETYLPAKYVQELGKRNRSYKINKNLVPVRAIVFQKNKKISLFHFPGDVGVFNYREIKKNPKVIQIKTSLGMKLNYRLECWTGLEFNQEEYENYLESKYYIIEKTDTSLKLVITSKIKSDTISYTSRWFNNLPIEYPFYSPLKCEGYDWRNQYIKGKYDILNKDSVLLEKNIEINVDLTIKNSRLLKELKFERNSLFPEFICTIPFKGNFYCFKALNDNKEAYYLGMQPENGDIILYKIDIKKYYESYEEVKDNLTFILKYLE